MAQLACRSSAPSRLRLLVELFLLFNSTFAGRLFLATFQMILTLNWDSNRDVCYSAGCKLRKVYECSTNVSNLCGVLRSQSKYILGALTEIDLKNLQDPLKAGLSLLLVYKLVLSHTANFGIDPIPGKYRASIPDTDTYTFNF